MIKSIIYEQLFSSQQYDTWQYIRDSLSLILNTRQGMVAYDPDYGLPDMSDSHHRDYKDECIDKIRMAIRRGGTKIKCIDIVSDQREIVGMSMRLRCTLYDDSVMNYHLVLNGSGEVLIDG